MCENIFQLLNTQHRVVLRCFTGEKKPQRLLCFQITIEIFEIPLDLTSSVSLSSTLWCDVTQLGLIVGSAAAQCNCHVNQSSCVVLDSISMLGRTSVRVVL